MGLSEAIRALAARLAGGPRPEREPAGVTVPEADHNLRELQRKLGHTFADVTLLRNALLHRSHIHVTGQEREQSNERLEFLGDAVLGLVVNEILYDHYPDRSEGDLTKMKSLLVCGARLSEVAMDFDLGIHIRMSRSEAATGGRRRSSILADTTEAIIGAVYLDGGLPAARTVIERVILSGSDRVLSRRSLRNYKSRLQEMIQSRYKTPPRYKVLEVDGPDHDRLFRVAVTHGGTVLGVGDGRNKKTAEQAAAREALDRLEREPELLDGGQE
ncbi:MAG: ribonuclease III [Krumholzibacteria bacterium]|nr:ribonuclease III [Candidatus Krumholzibacteria bacterium]